MYLNYESPQIEVIEVEVENVMCASDNMEDMSYRGSFGDF